MRWGRPIALAIAAALVVSACTTSATTTSTSFHPTAVSTTAGDAPVDPALAEALPIDPDVRIGTLENGLTYYLRFNDSPGGQVELRLAVNVGSVQEDDDQSGSAHFLEHMM